MILCNDDGNVHWVSGISLFSRSLLHLTSDDDSIMLCLVTVPSPLYVSCTLYFEVWVISWGVKMPAVACVYAKQKNRLLAWNWLLLCSSVNVSYSPLPSIWSLSLCVHPQLIPVLPVMSSKNVSCSVNFRLVLFTRLQVGSQTSLSMALNVALLKASLHWSFNMIIMHDSYKVNSVDKWYYVYTLHWQWTGEYNSKWQHLNLGV